MVWMSVRKRRSTLGYITLTATWLHEWRWVMGEVRGQDDEEWGQSNGLGQYASGRLSERNIHYQKKNSGEPHPPARPPTYLPPRVLSGPEHGPVDLPDGGGADGAVVKLLEDLQQQSGMGVRWESGLQQQRACMGGWVGEWWGGGGSVSAVCRLD